MTLRLPNLQQLSFSDVLQIRSDNSSWAFLREGIEEAVARAEDAIEKLACQPSEQDSLARELEGESARIADREDSRHPTPSGLARLGRAVTTIGIAFVGPAASITLGDDTVGMIGGAAGAVAAGVAVAGLELRDRRSRKQQKQKQALKTLLMADP
jgi:hypothetical protein